MRLQLQPGNRRHRPEQQRLIGAGVNVAPAPCKGEKRRPGWRGGSRQTHCVDRVHRAYDLVMDQKPTPADTCITRAWRAHQGEIEGYLRRRVSNGEQAADLLQTVFLKALHEGRNFCSLREPRAWLFAVARNALADYLRSRHVFDPLPDEIEDEAEDTPAVDTLADCLPFALAELDAADRDVINLCELQGMKQKDYAALRGLSLAATKSRVLRARVRLREALVLACGVRFDAASGRVCCYVPRAASTNSETKSA